MRNNLDDAAFATEVSQLIIGAGEAIALKSRHVDLREFGFQPEDIANLADQRLCLRCLVPLPGLYRNRDGSIYKERDIEYSEFGSLKSSLSILEDAGWQTRLIPDRPLVSSLSIDRNAVIYYEYLNDRPGPFLSTKRGDIAHYLDQFETSWATSFEVSDVETLYDESKSLGSLGGPQIAVFSHETWTGLIDRLSIKPRLLYELPPRKFEELIAELLAREGLEVHLTPETRDGGRDILAFHQTPVGKLLYLVECKRFRPDRPVGIAIVQRLYGVVQQERANAGLVVTTSRFSNGALTFADTVQHQLRLRDYEALKIWLQKCRDIK